MYGVHLTNRISSKFVSHIIVLAVGFLVGIMTVLLPRSARDWRTKPSILTLRTMALSKDGRPQVYNKSTESQREGGRNCDVFSQNVAKMVSRSHLLQNFCPCCGFHGNLSVFSGRPHAMCPSCKALERHRTACFNLAKHDLLKSTGKLKRILHFGPLPSMRTGIESACAEARLDHIPVDFFAKGYHYSKGTIFADVTKLSFPDNFVNLILIFHVLEHIRKLDAAFRELHRVLEKGGKMLIEVPCNTSQRDHKDCRRFHNESDLVACAGQRDHVWRFSCNKFKRQLSDAGFKCNATVPQLNTRLPPQYICENV